MVHIIGLLEKSKKIGKYRIILSDHGRYMKSTFYEVSVHLNQKTMYLTKNAIIGSRIFDSNNRMPDRGHAVETYTGMKTVSDVHRFLHEVNPTDRPLHPSDGRMTYNNRSKDIKHYDASGYPLIKR